MLLSAYLKDEGCHCSGWSNRQIQKDDSPESERSLMKIRNTTAPRTLPWGTPALTGRGDERIPLKATHWRQESAEVSTPCVELALDTTGREFAEQGRMPDCVKSTRYVQRDGPDLMSDIEGLHPLLGESKQHVQSRVTLSENKFVI